MGRDLEGITLKSIGQPVRRKEDARLLTGKGKFTDDFSLEGQSYAVMVRSPHAHALLKGFDLEAALAMPGVLGIFTGADLEADGVNPIPHSPVPKTKYDMKLKGPGGTEIFIGPHVLLPTDKARHVGEAVAMVIAESVNEALDAAEVVEVDYETLDHVTETAKTFEPGQPLVWDEAENNTLVDTVFGDVAATDAAFAAAKHVVEKTLYVGRVTGVPLEPRAALAAYDAAEDSYTIYAGSGGAVRQKAEMSNVINIDPEK